MRMWQHVFIIAGILAGGGAPVELTAQTPAKIYPASDAVKDIDAAFAASSKDGKHVLLDFGADWCPDCRVLGALFESEGVAPFASANFHVVHIDVGRRDKNDDLVVKYGATSADWIPAVVVLDAERRTVAATDATVRLTRRTTAEQLLSLLQAWAPKRVVRDLASFTKNGVRVSVTVQEDSSRQSWLAATFVPEGASAHLYSKDLPAAGVNGLGRPTRFGVVSAAGLRVVGDVASDRRALDDRIDELRTTLSVYPPGPVTLRLPVRLETAASAELSLSYMACGEDGCRAPVTDHRVVVTLPSVR